MTRTLLLDRFVLTGAGLCLLLVGAAGWSAFGEALFPPREKPAFTHLHCSECLDEFLYFPALDGKPCPTCGEEKSHLIPTVGALSEGGYTPGQSRWDRVFAFLVISVVLVEAQVLLCVWRGRVLRRRAQETQDRKLVCRCPFCNRKLAYPTRKGGTALVCPFCKTGFLLPHDDDPDDDATE